MVNRVSYKFGNDEIILETGKIGKPRLVSIAVESEWNERFKLSRKCRKSPVASALKSV